MNIKEILGLGLLFVAISSCSEESPIDDRPYETGTVTLNFTMQGVTETKGAESIGSTEIYTHTTEAERSVKNCVIAIFAKGEKEEWSKHIYSNYYDVNSTTGAFKITDLVLPINTDLKILAIANDPRVSEMVTPEGKIASKNPDTGSSETWETYSDWENAFAWYQLPPVSFEKNKEYCTFNPETLIKFGELEMRFNAKGELVDKNNQIIGNGVAKVPLFQLASKILLELSFEKSESFTLKEHVGIKNVRLYSGIMSYWNKDNFPAYSDKNQREVDDDYTFLSGTVDKIFIPFYTYAKQGENESIDIVFEGTMGKSVKLNRFNIALWPTQTSGFVRGNYYHVTGVLRENQNAEVHLTYEVNEWNPTSVTIPDFE